MSEDFKKGFSEFILLAILGALELVFINILYSINEYGWTFAAGFQLAVILGLIVGFEEIKDYSLSRAGGLFLGVFLVGIYILSEIDLFFHLCYLIVYLDAKITS